MRRSRRHPHRPIPVLTALCVLLAAIGECQTPTPASAAAGPGATGAAPPTAGSPAGALVVEVTGVPAANYRTGEPIADEDEAIAGELARRTRGLAFSSRLARAARAYATAADPAAEHPLPEAFVEFVLHFAGCPDPRATGALVYTTEDDSAAVWDHLAGLLAGNESYTHVGIGRVPHPGDRFRWRWAILLVDRLISLAPLPTSGAPGQRLRLSFTLREGLRAPQAIVQAPDGTALDASLTPSGQGWVGEIALSQASGEQIVEILANDEHGPAIAALFPITVGRSPATTWRGAAVARGEVEEDPAELARRMADMVNREREQRGLPALAWHPGLAAIARRHSQDMMANGFLGHVSPTAGDLRQRLHAAGVMVRYASENLSHAASLDLAHDSLLRSPGHLRNMLSGQATHLGIGIVVTVRRGALELTITQIFAHPYGLVPPGA